MGTIEKYLRHAGFSGPFFEPFPDSSGEPVQRHVRVDQLQVSEGGLGLEAVRAAHDGIDHDATFQVDHLVLTESRHLDEDGNDVLGINSEIDEENRNVLSKRNRRNILAEVKQPRATKLV